jgi:hypothetical protein
MMMLWSCSFSVAYALFEYPHLTLTNMYHTVDVEVQRVVVARLLRCVTC